MDLEKLNARIAELEKLKDDTKKRIDEMHAGIEQDKANFSACHGAQLECMEWIKKLNAPPQEVK